jgi:hypothetical protein
MSDQDTADSGEFDEAAVAGNRRNQQGQRDQANWE